MHHCEKREEDSEEKEECGAGPSCVSMRSDQSMHNPITFTSDLRYSTIPMNACGNCFQNNLQCIQATHTTCWVNRLRDKHLSINRSTFEKAEYSCFHNKYCFKAASQKTMPYCLKCNALLQCILTPVLGPTSLNV